MTRPTYTPRADSLASQCIAFFRYNPDEELMLDDIQNKFTCTRGNIHTLLKPAVEAGWLFRGQNSDGEWIYAKGDNLQADTDTLDTRALPEIVARTAPAAKGFASQRHVIDIDAGRWSLIDKPGRSPATLSRIKAGRAAHGSRFVAPYFGSGSGLTGRSLSRPVGTITTRDRWAVIDGDRMRMLNVQECRRAMGFPEGYLLPDRAKDAMHMLGNAVVPPVARDVINAIREAA